MNVCNLIVFHNLILSIVCICGYTLIATTTHVPQLYHIVWENYRRGYSTSAMMSQLQLLETCLRRTLSSTIVKNNIKIIRSFIFSTFIYFTVHSIFFINFSFCWCWIYLSKFQILLKRCLFWHTDVTFSFYFKAL